MAEHMNFTLPATSTPRLGSAGFPDTGHTPTGTLGGTSPGSRVRADASATATWPSSAMPWKVMGPVRCVVRAP